MGERLIDEMNRRSGRLFLRPNCVAEPLVDRWYAWSHLIAPATLARNLTHRHLPIMDSYVDDPEGHAEAAQNPALAGGPFVNYESDRSQEIAALAQTIRQQRASLLELSQAIADLELLLDEHARGFSLEAAYRQLPEPLRGCVELAYDLRHRPVYRLIEPLLYNRFDGSAGQSLMLSTLNNDDRSFIFSTPRLDRTDALHWQTGFGDPAVDQFFRFRREAVSYEQVAELLRVRGVSEPLAGLLTDLEPAPARRYGGPGIRWRYFGHACVLVETSACAILTDPAIGYPFSGASHRFTADDLPPFIDFVLITHAHQDHLLLEALLPLRDRIGTILVPRNSAGHLQDPSLRLILRSCGFKHVVEMAEMDEVVDGAVRLVAIPFFGEHCDLEIVSKTAWLLRIGARSMLFAADSRNLSPELYRAVHDQVGDVGTIFLGMECDGAPLSWIYGPLLTRRVERGIDQSRRANASDCAGALALAEVLRCRELYVYAMGQEPWLRFISSIRYTADSRPIIESDRLIETLRERGIVAQRLYGCHEQILA